MLAARTTQQGRLKILLRLFSFVGVALVLALIFNQPSHASGACTSTSKNMLGGKVACKDVGGSAAEFPLNIFKYDLKVDSFEKLETQSAGQGHTSFELEGTVDGDLFYAQLNKTSQTAYETPNWKQYMKLWLGQPIDKIEKLKVRGGYGRQTKVSDECTFFAALVSQKRIVLNVVACGAAISTAYEFFKNLKDATLAENLAYQNASSSRTSGRSDQPTKSAEYRACQTAKGDSSKTAKFMQSLTQSQLTKFLNKNQSCDAF